MDIIDILAIILALCCIPIIIYAWPKAINAVQDEP